MRMKIQVKHISICRSIGFAVRLVLKLRQKRTWKRPIGKSKPTSCIGQLWDKNLLSIKNVQLTVMVTNRREFPVERVECLLIYLYLELTWKRWISPIWSSDVQNVLPDLLIVKQCQSGNGAGSCIHFKLRVHVHCIEQHVLHFSVCARVKICCRDFPHFLVDTLGMEKVQDWTRLRGNNLGRFLLTAQRLRKQGARTGESARLPSHHCGRPEFDFDLNFLNFTLFCTYIFKLQY